jgi:hypothetical protein
MRAPRKTWTPQEDALLRKMIAAGWLHRVIGQALGRPKQGVTSRWNLLRRGLRKHAWSPDEDALIRDTAGYRTAESIGAELGRTPAAVSDRASIIGANWWRPDQRRVNIGFTGTQVARMLGVPCSKTIAEWIDKGYLPASRRAPRLGEHNYKVAYRVMPDALRAFLRDYPWLYDRDRIADKGWAAYVGANVPRERWMGTREAAQLLCMTEANVGKAIRQGDLRAEKVGPNWVITEAAIRAYVPPPLGYQATKYPEIAAQVAARRAANLAARKSVCYRQRPEAVARMEAGRAKRRQQAA